MEAFASWNWTFCYIYVFRVGEIVSCIRVLGISVVVEFSDALNLKKLSCWYSAQEAVTVVNTTYYLCMYEPFVSWFIQWFSYFPKFEEAKWGCAFSLREIIVYFHPSLQADRFDRRDVFTSVKCDDMIITEGGIKSDTTYKGSSMIPSLTGEPSKSHGYEAAQLWPLQRLIHGAKMHGNISC